MEKKSRTKKFYNSQKFRKAVANAFIIGDIRKLSPEDVQQLYKAYETNLIKVRPDGYIILSPELSKELIYKNLDKYPNFKYVAVERWTRKLLEKLEEKDKKQAN